MSELITRTARLAPYAKRPRQASGFVTAYSYEPAPNDATASFGNLFVVIEVISSGRMAEEVADLVIETIGQHYYNLNPVDKDPLQRFELAIKAVNSELSRYIDRGNAAWVGKLSAIIAIQTASELHLAQTGSAEAFLSRGKASTRITSAPGPRGPQPNKTFGAITSGNLESGDRLLLATPALIHQLSLSKLRSIISSTSPTGAIAEITALLEGSANDRVAALVIEVTTPELASLQMRADEPDEVILQSNETPLDIARQAAVPLAQTAVTSGKRLGAAAIKGIESLKPHARRVALTCVQGLRRFLTGRGNQRRLALVGFVVFVIALTVVMNNQHNAAVARLEARFNHDRAAEQAAALGLTTADKAAAETKLTAIQQDLRTIASDKDIKALDKRLAPSSVSALQQTISKLLDQAENLQRVDATTVASFSSKSGTPTHFELIGAMAVAIDATGRTISQIDLTTGAVKVSTADTSQLGSVVATTLSSSGDGIYILTQTPAVWLYKPAGDSLTKQSIGQGAWPIASSIASYNSNLYFIDSGSDLLKAVRTLAGYGPTAVSLSPTSNPELAGAHAMAVDGSIYVLSDKGLLQYLSGILKQTVSVPTSLSHATELRSIGDGSTLLANDPSTGRTGIFSYAGSTLAFSRQFAINGAAHVYDATIDPASNTVYALSDGKLVKFSLR